MRYAGRMKAAFRAGAAFLFPTMLLAILMAATPGGLSVAGDAYGPGPPPGPVLESGGGKGPQAPAGTPAGTAPEQAPAPQGLVQDATQKAVPEGAPAPAAGAGQAAGETPQGPTPETGSGGASGGEEPPTGSGQRPDEGAPQEPPSDARPQEPGNPGPPAGPNVLEETGQAAGEGPPRQFDPVDTQAPGLTGNPEDEAQPGVGQVPEPPCEAAGGAEAGQEPQNPQAPEEPAGSGAGQGGPVPPSVSEVAYPKPEEGPSEEPPLVPPPMAESVRDAVYPPSVAEAVYRPEPPYPLPGLKVAKEPPPFRARDRAVVEAALRSDLPVMAILDRVEGLPGTVSAAVYHPDVGVVAEVRGETVIRAVYFPVAGEMALEFRLSGFGKIQDAKFHFREVPAER